jgi:hypothetical protein
LAVEKVPKPTRLSLSPFLRAAVTVPMKAATAFSASTFFSPAPAATALISSAFVMVHLQNLCVNPKRVSVYQILPGTVKKKILANVQFTGDERLLPIVMHVQFMKDNKVLLL